jgi:DNA/RNA-binding domain of Phe-tRNA-synthetase-like protein
MQFNVHPEIFERFAGLNLAVVVAHGIDNEAEQPGVEEKWRKVWAEAEKAAVYGNAQSHPGVKPWREHFTAMGVSGKQFPSSIEAVLRRALKGGEPFQINPLVDFYNTVSLEHVVPAGGFDLAQIEGPLELRLSRSGDTFMALDEDKPQAVPAGEVAYADGQTILTRHFVWRQASTALIVPATRSVVLVSEVLGELGREVAEQVQSALHGGLETYFHARPISFIVDAHNSTISWCCLRTVGSQESLLDRFACRTI